MRSFMFLVALPLVACGGDDDGGGGVKVPDASMQQADAPPVSCSAQADYGTPTPVDVIALRFCGQGNQLTGCPATETNGIVGTATDPEMIAYYAQLNAQNDYLSVELWKGSPPFGDDPIAPAAGVDLSSSVQSQYMTCGVCVYLDAQYDDETGDVAGTYMANAGTADITTVNMTVDAAMSQLAGSLSSVNMVHVDFGQGGLTTPNADGCTTSVLSYTFDVAVDDVPSAFTGKQRAAFEKRVLDRVNARLRARAR